MKAAGGGGRARTLLWVLVAGSLSVGRRRRWFAYRNCVRAATTNDDDYEKETDNAQTHSLSFRFYLS